MTKIHSHTLPIGADIVDAFCLMQKGFTDQFVYYDKQRACRYMGLGRCIALPTLDGAESELEGPVEQPPVYFSTTASMRRIRLLPTSCSRRSPG